MSVERPAIRQSNARAEEWRSVARARRVARDVAGALSAYVAAERAELEALPRAAVMLPRELLAVIDEEVVERPCECAEALCALSDVYVEFGRVRAAVALLENRAKRLRPALPVSDRLSLLLRLLVVDPSHDHAHVAAAEAYATLGDLDASMRHFDAAIELLRHRRGDAAAKTACARVLARRTHLRSDAAGARLSAAVVLDEGGELSALMALVLLREHLAEPVEDATLELVARAFDQAQRPADAQTTRDELALRRILHSKKGQ